MTSVFITGKPPPENRSAIPATGGIHTWGYPVSASASPPLLQHAPRLPGMGLMTPRMMIKNGR